MEHMGVGQCSSDDNISVVSVTAEVMSQSLWLRRDWILRWCREMSHIHQRLGPSHCCSVQHRVVMWVRCNIIGLASTAWLESLCRRGRVVVVVDCSAVECYDCPCQRPTRDLHCLMTSDKATWRPWMNIKLYHGRLLHSPTHRHSHSNTDWLIKDTSATRQSKLN